MIELPRFLARHLNVVLRRIARRTLDPLNTLVDLRGGPDGLRIQFPHPEIAVECHYSGSYAEEFLTLPLVALAEVEGRGQELVTLEPVGDGKVRASWDDAGVPRSVEFAAPDRSKQPPFPSAPKRFVRNESTLLRALVDASACASKDPVRYATNRLCFSGQAGELVATDGKHLLIQRGFRFPWQGEILAVPCPVLASKELGEHKVIGIGRCEEHVVLRFGPWTFFLRIEANARFPRYIEVVPRINGECTRWRIDPQDGDFLLRTLPQLPGKDADTRPVTIELNGQVRLRAGDSGENAAEEVVLARSESSGKPMQLCLNREYLARAIQLGFSEMHLVDPERPVLFRDEKRIYVIMPLGTSSSAPVREDARRTMPPREEAPQSSAPTERNEDNMSTPQHNDNGQTDKTSRTRTESQENGQAGFDAVLVETQALKDALRDAYGRASRLLAALQRQRKQSKLVQTTLASLRQLQQIGG